MVNLDRHLLPFPLVLVNEMQNERAYLLESSFSVFSPFSVYILKLSILRFVHLKKKDG